jgi:hypothetical protein
VDLKPVAFFPSSSCRSWPVEAILDDDASIFDPVLFSAFPQNDRP